MGTNLTGPNVLLRQLRTVMAEALEPQERLDTIVQDIAENMVSSVCSVYTLRSDGVLELYSSKGLNPQSVHLSTLRVGQGLVGTIAATARALNLVEAQKHPAFAYLPETGEESFKSFLGVPILRSGRVLGVLVVQDQHNRAYSDAELEALETTAMVLAELIATGELDSISSKGTTLDLARTLRIEALSLSDGIGFGNVVLHEPRVVVTNLFNESAEEEVRRLREALLKLQVSIDVLFQSGNVPSEGEHRDVLEAYRMFAHDRGWNRRMEEAINNGLTAEAAVEKVQNDYRARLMRQADPFLRDRLSDFEDLANRLLRELSGEPHKINDDRFKQDYIIVARTMGAAELLDYNSGKLRGLVLEEAAPTSHVVIVARALGIPVVGQLPDFAANCEEGNMIVVDGDEGIVCLRPPQDFQDAYREKITFRAGRMKQFAKLLDKPAVTKDGIPISLQMNAGLLMDLAQLDQCGAEGIGLFRTELQFMVSSTLPRVSEQEALYTRVLDEVGDRPVTFRALDIGGDKVLPYLKSLPEENPAMGWRALRLSMDRQALIKSQIRALLKAAGGRHLRLMLPMVTEVSEIRAVRKIIKREVELQTRLGHEMPRLFELGAMLEVPNLLFQLDELMLETDFVSVGSNDLFQFAFACDRGNANLANRYSPISRSFLRMLREIQIASEKYHVPLTLCGEIAGRPLAAMALLGLGYKRISMSPASIGPVKAVINSLDVSALQAILFPALEEYGYEVTMDELLADFADKHGILH
ncbi:MAG: phosphoenolpyruvate--protein phosphotransferase [Pseudomonadota bacterium]